MELEKDFGDNSTLQTPFERIRFFDFFSDHLSASVALQMLAKPHHQTSMSS